MDYKLAFAALSARSANTAFSKLITEYRNHDSVTVTNRPVYLFLPLLSGNYQSTRAYCEILGDTVVRIRKESSESGLSCVPGRWRLHANRSVPVGCLV